MAELTFAERMMNLFQGMESAHGTYEIPGTKQKGVKRLGKALTLREPVTVELWQQHLDGERSLGVVPINEQNLCKWGVIDIDEYGLNHKSIALRVGDLALPLILCRSKSGGGHLFLFTKEFIPAVDMQTKLRDFAAILGLGQCEIFPKQREILPEKGDVGNWLNMPYFKYKGTDRYAYSMDGKKIPLEDFLKDAEETSLSTEDFHKAEASEHASTTEADFQDGPPCLQALIAQGFPEGTRNNGLFAMAVFARKKFPDRWRKKVEEWNTERMKPPLSSSEVQEVVKQAAKKDYQYRCNDIPIVAFCNSAVCRTRQYGVGSAGSMPDFTGLSKLDAAEQSVWFLQTPLGRLELQTEELQQQQKFQRKCMDMLNLMPPKMKEQQWQAVVQKLMDDVVIIDSPKGTSNQDQFYELLDDFCADARSQELNQEQLLLGKPWYDSETKRIYFRLRDLQEHLERHNFKNYTKTQIVSRLNDINGQDKCSRFFNIKGKGCNTWFIEEQKLSDQFGVQEEPYDLPDMGEGAF